MAGTIHGLIALLFVAGALCVALLGSNLLTYQRLTHEQLAAEVAFRSTGAKRFSVTVTIPGEPARTFALSGDQWQVDARVIKWQGLASILGFDSVYRLERIGGRYDDIDQERSEPHTVFDLNPVDRLDAWTLLRQARRYLPWIDAIYGSAVYLPMTDGAQYEVMVGQSGLLARPVNSAARESIGAWGPAKPSTGQ
jgi:hypothetical protein